MAKVVIAGRSDCPYFSRIELLGDRMMKSLPSFQLHKIVKTPGEWPAWILRTCQKHGWDHETSPIVWREVLDSGGKAVLIGGANDFQEYIKGYYNQESSLTTEDMMKISMDNFNMKKELDIEEAHFRSLSKPVHICVTGIESSTCYALLASLASGELFGIQTKIVLRLLPSVPSLLVKGLAMEVQDLCCGPICGVEVVDCAFEAFKNCSLIVMLDELLQEEGEEMEKWIWRNCQVFSTYAKQINAVAPNNVRVVLAGNGPVNFNTMVVIKNAPNIPRQNIVAVSLELENRAKSIIAQRLDVNTAEICDLIIWGNTSGHRFIDTSHSRVYGFEGAIKGPRSYYETVVKRVHDNKWLEKEFLTLAEERKSSIETALGHVAAASAAVAIVSTLNYLLNGSPQDLMFSLAVYSEGWYGVPEGVVFSYPVRMTPKGHWTVVQDIELTKENQEILLDIVRGLIQEAQVVFPSFHDCLPAIETSKRVLSAMTEGETTERSVPKEDSHFDDNIELKMSGSSDD